MHKVLLGIFFLLLIASTSFAQPVIHFAETSHDFGAVSGGKVVKHIFEFRNTGDQELVIKKVSAS